MTFHRFYGFSLLVFSTFLKHRRNIIFHLAHSLFFLILKKCFAKSSIWRFAEIVLNFVIIFQYSTFQVERKKEVTVFQQSPSFGFDLFQIHTDSI
jgi:hypothetical protein